MSYFTPQFETIDVNSSKTFWKGFYMWFLLFVGYFLFTANWFVMTKLKGDTTDKGWASHFGIASLPSEKIISQLVGYAIILGRGIAFLTAAWVLNKFTHKYSVLLALAMNSIAFILIWAPAYSDNIKYFGYSLLVIGRLFMAFGGSLIIIYVQPIINKFIFGTNKKVLSILSSCAYPFASIILNLIFLSSDLTKEFIQNWWTVAGIFAALTYIPLILYFFVGIHFDTSVDNNKAISGEKKSYFLDILTSKEDWISILFYSFLIFISVAISWEFTDIATAINSELTADLEVFGGKVKWGSVYLTCFYCGCGSGMSMGWFTTRKMKRTTVLKLSTLMVCIFWSIIAICINFTGALINAAIFISVYFISFFGMGLQAVFFYMPYERKGTDIQRITTFFSILWGVGYLLYLVYVVVLNLLSEYSGGNNKYVGGRYALFFMFLVMQIYFVFSFLLKETRPNWSTFSLQATQDFDENNDEIQESTESLVTTETVESSRRN